MPGFDIKSYIPSACHDGPTPTPGYNSKLENNIETARRYRYRLEILEPLNQDNLLLLAYRITRPTVEFDQVTIHNGQGEIYRPGKNRWMPIEVAFYERVSGVGGARNDPNATGGYDKAASLIYKWWAETLININNSLHGNLTAYRKPAEVAMLDGLGNAIWTYYLVNCWPLKVDPSDLSYIDSEIADITLTLSYDRALEKKEWT